MVGKSTVDPNRKVPEHRAFFPGKALLSLEGVYLFVLAFRYDLALTLHPTTSSI
jgi:hypothetical protein